jgi:preprotein translocase subunit SecD
VARSGSSRPGRTLGVLVGLIAVVYGLIGGGSIWGNAQWVPKLALDLEGGTEIVLTPVPQPGTTGTVTQQTLNEAVKIIRQRINGSGVSEAEITTQGGRNIVVSLPGKTDEATHQAVKRAAALEFRAVLKEQQLQAPEETAPTESPAPTSTPGSSPKVTGSASTGASGPATLKSVAPSAAASSNGMAVPNALLAAPTTPGPSPTGAGSPSVSPPGASGAPSPTAVPKPTDASDLNWIYDESVAAQMKNFDCSKKENLAGLVVDDLTKPLVTCSKDGSAAYILGPAEVTGSDISSASASLETSSQGAIGTAWQVNLEFKSEGSSKFAKVTQRLVGLEAPRNQFAIVLDGLVVSAPRTNEAITGGRAQITGDFSEAEAQSLANQLKFGALPVSFQEQTEQNISATLGGEQLQRGLLAGLIGLGLVVLYSLLQYRALGFVTVASLGIAGFVTYGFVVLLGWRQGYRLSLPGVAGLIVSIGITADSFIVYFERIRDEVRDGRGLLPAVEAAWLRARRTILISDGVSFLAAVVLWLLALGGVKGFAFTLGLTTLVDVVVVFLFTHPTVVLLGRTRFFGSGHRLSGFDAAHLGRSITYTGRGTVRKQPRRGTRTKGARLPSTGASSGEVRGRSDQETIDLSADQALVGSSTVSARSGMTIAERRAAAERARREALLTELGGGDTDGSPPRAGSGSMAASGDTAQAEATGDARTGRKDS